MDRRSFLQWTGAAGASSLAGKSLSAVAQGGPKASAQSTAKGGRKKWLFWDLWHLDRRENLQLCQGKPTWVRDAVYVDDVDGLAAWPTVYRDVESGRWRMLYTSRWKPWTLMVAESEDGFHFHPRPFPEIEPEGGKVAPHHVFSLPHGSCGGVYVDPVATDGYRLRVFGHQQGKPVYERAKADPAHRWHKAANRGWSKTYMAEETMLVSRDGVHWEVRPDVNWGLPDWHPEPPIFCFYNRRLGRYMMTVRPGWGDRRVCLQSTENFRDWSGPELLLQPDSLDEDLCELYGMPVFPYAGGYVGLLWVFHCEQSEPTKYYNRSVGPLDVQLAYSYDGVRFFRGLREPFIPLNPPGEHGCGGIESSSMVELDDEIRIFSSASKVPHGRNFLARKAGAKDFEGILMHTLRKDGFMYLRSRGDWAAFGSKPLVLFDNQLTMNIEAPFGEAHYQLTSIDSKPLEGFSYDDCEPFVASDSLEHRLRWRQRRVQDVVGEPIRLQVKFRDAHVYALAGNFHFLDAQDMHMLRDGEKIDPSLFDF